MFTLLALSITLFLLQQQQQQQQIADDGETFDSQHNYLHISCYRPMVWIYYSLQSVNSTVNYVLLLLWTYSMFGTQDYFHLC